jgi:hypothetical protein
MSRGTSSNGTGNRDDEKEGRLKTRMTQPSDERELAEKRCCREGDTAD